MNHGSQPDSPKSDWAISGSPASGVRMSKTMFCFLVIFLLQAGSLRAQQKSVVDVKASRFSNGVVLVEILKGAKGFDLQCNQGAPACEPLKAGKYQLLELPKNTGMYECQDVQVFSESDDASDPDKKLGEYCLTDK
jgi:hypothetical protein